MPENPYQDPPVDVPHVAGPWSAPATALHNVYPMISSVPNRPARRLLRHLPWPALAALGLALLAAGCGGADGGAHGGPADLTGEGLVIVRGGSPADPEVEGSLPRPNFHDFGAVPWGEVVEHTFELRNTDPVSVVLMRATPSCNCTIPRLVSVAPDGAETLADSSDPEGLLRIPPGGTLRVDLRVDTKAVLQPNRDKLVSVRLVTDSPSSAYITLEIHLVATRDLTVFPTVADLKNVATSVGGSVDVTISTAGEETLRPTEVLQSPAGFAVSMGPDPRSDVHWIVTTRLDPGAPEGFAGGTITIGTVDLEGEAGPPLQFPTRALVVPDVQVSPPGVSLRPSGAGLAHQVRVLSHLPGHRFRIDRVEIQPDDLPGLETVAVPRGAGDSASSWDIQVTVAEPDPLRRYEGTLIVHLDDPQYPRLEVPLVSHGGPQ